MEVDFTIPIMPLAKQSVRGGTNGFYQDPKYAKWAKSFMLLSKSLCKHKFTRYAFIEVIYAFPYKKWPKKSTRLRWSHEKQQREGVAIIDGVEYKISKPDVHDNLSKLPMDCLQKIGILRDDSIVVKITASKIFSEKGFIKIKITGE
jgi:Holliday junction resolvase RusA-like endonuclease